MGDNAPSVAIIIPARDEERNIARCLVSLAAQDYPRERLSICLIDDHSVDATIEIARSIAHRAPSLTVVRCPPLPEGWTGKCYACWVGAGAAVDDAEWLCFIDADMKAEPSLLTSAVVAASAECVDILSLAPRQELRSFAERIIIPCGLYTLGFCRHLGKAQSQECDEPTVTGQFMLIRRSAYVAAGGHAAVRGSICEDVALARAAKRNGDRVLLLDGREMLSTRMYNGWGSLWPGLTKNLVETLGGPLRTATTAVTAVALAWAIWLTPAVDGWDCANGAAAACFAAVPALGALGAAIGLHLSGSVYFGIPLYYGLLFPVGYTVGMALAFDSIRRRRLKRRRWKGRVYP
ncbi:glycosyltransferase [Methylosinus sp. KRF6]|uniref:glycosyltransferase n=1 Tax=Methylosinus sp. KRF6 TaxID=2846853 RepID=UPI001C0D38DF|nr:glycosyltransferase [Methylosinus sp. KRF6]MBU3887878.1 glycosyltransferase [Methylosinus sp. KRF6]